MMTHMSLFGQQLPSGYQSAACSRPFIGLSYGSISGPLAHFSSLDVSSEGGEGRNSIRTLCHTLHMAQSRTSDVAYVTHLLCAYVQPVSKASINNETTAAADFLS